VSGRVVLICHGSTAATRGTAFPLDEGLEPAGLAAAQAAVGRGAGGRAVLCGPALRCRQTAEALGLPEPMVDAGLADWDLGDWAGRSLAELAADSPDDVQAWTTDPDFAGHGGETLTRVIERVAGWLDQPSNEPNASAGRPDRVIAVTHPAVIRSAVVHALQAPAHSFWRIDVAPLAVVELRGAPGRWSLYPQPF
jgi:broad specificity phosphatase PhoE